MSAEKAACPLPVGISADDIGQKYTVSAPPLNDDIKELLEPKPEPENTSLQKEFVDDIDVANKKIQHFVEHLKKSKYTVIYTGAGISTNTNRLADFRGDKGLISNRPPLVLMGISEQKMDSIMPTFTHLCIKLLMDHGYIQKVITSNHDGLHNKTNIKRENVLDLFGNVYVEKCRKCKQRYLRKTVVSHLYRKCDKTPKCRGKLKREKCNMNEFLDTKYLEKAHAIAEKSTLSLVLGSSMTIRPFCTFPPKAMPSVDNKDKIGFVLVTRQETEYDEDALECIHINVDDFMIRVMKELKLEKECKQFVYLQVFDCNIVIQSSNDMIYFVLKSKETNEGLPFIQSASIQIVKQKETKEEKKENDDGHELYDIVKEYYLQKMNDLNWKFEIIKHGFLDMLNKEKDYKVQIEIEWESGFEMKEYRTLLDNMDWDKMDVLQTMEMELRKVVSYDVF